MLKVITGLQITQTCFLNPIIFKLQLHTLLQYLPPPDTKKDLPPVLNVTSLLSAVVYCAAANMGSKPDVHSNLSLCCHSHTLYFNVNMSLKQTLYSYTQVCISPLCKSFGTCIADINRSHCYDLLYASFIVTLLKKSAILNINSDAIHIELLKKTKKRKIQVFFNLYNQIDIVWKCWNKITKVYQKHPLYKWLYVESVSPLKKQNRKILNSG